MAAANWARSFLILAIVALLAFAGYGLYRNARKDLPQLCDTCKREIMPHSGFIVETKHEIVRYCCPRCWLTSLRARDFGNERLIATVVISGELVPAAKCLYVEGSNVMHCCGVSMTRGQMNAAPAVECYDRCLPSVIPFASADGAAEFAAKHGGKIINFETFTGEAKKNE